MSAVKHTFSRIKYLDIAQVPFTSDMATMMFYTQVQQMVKKMSGEFNSNDRVVTVQDLKDLGLVS
jgi:hypothetical protein